MNTVPLKKFIRILNANLGHLQTFNYNEVVKQLIAKNFTLVETSSDWVVETYSNPDYTDPTKGMWMRVGLSDEIGDVIFTTNVDPRNR